MDDKLIYFPGRWRDGEVELKTDVGWVPVGIYGHDMHDTKVCVENKFGFCCLSTEGRNTL